MTAARLMRNASATEPTPMEPTSRSEKRNRRPSSPLTAAPNSGRRGTSQMYLCIRFSERRTVNSVWRRPSFSSLFNLHYLPLQQINLVHEDRLAVAVERDDEAEADGRLGGGDDDDEDREDLTGDGVGGARAARRVQVAREGDEVQVRRVQDQLYRHEDDDDVASRQHAGHADGEEQRPDDEELREVGVLQTLPDVVGGLPDDVCPGALQQETERRREKAVHSLDSE